MAASCHFLRLKNLDEYRIPIIDMVDFIYDQKEKGAIDLDDDLSQDVDDLHQALSDARQQLEGEKSLAFWVCWGIQDWLR